MLADLLLTLAWSLFTLSATTVTFHLYRNAGVLVASQNLIMAVSALVDALLMQAGFNSLTALLIAMTTGVLLGLLHLPVLFKAGVTLLLVLTALASFVLTEVWYALPSVTGGSGGILLPQEISNYDATLLLLLVLITSRLYLRYKSSQANLQFDWETLKTLGPISGAFGVQSTKIYVTLFSLYGLLVGMSGVAVARYLGYLSVSTFSLSWSLAIVLIAVSLNKQPYIYVVLLCTVYGTVRVMLRQTVYASSFWSNLFEILFPIVLLTIVIYSRRQTSKRKLSTHSNTRH